MDLMGGIGRALRHRNYRVYWASNALNTIGRWMYRVAMAWLTWELTESTSWLGIVAFAEVFPLVVFAVLAGAIADRIGYLRITVWAQAVTFLAAIVFAGLALADMVTIELVLIFALLIGSLESLTTPARMAMVHGLVTKEDMPSAIALNSATFNAARFIGPAIAAALLEWVGSAWVLAIVAATFTQFWFVLLKLQVEEPERNPGPWRDLVTDIVSGCRYGFGHPGIRFLMVLLGITGLFIRPVIDLVAGLSAQEFDRGPDGVGILLSTLGFGAMFAGLWLAQRGRNERLTAFVTHSLLFQALALGAAMLTGHIWVAAGLLGIVGFSMVVAAIGSQSLIQNTVSSDMRARVMSLLIVVSWGLPALGALVEGWLASFLGLPIVICGGAALTLVLWLWAQSRIRLHRSSLEQE
jgi:MFS family permease